MAIRVWNPWFDMNRELRSMLDRAQPALLDEGSFPFRPSIDVARENGSLVVTAELAGIDPAEDVQVTVEDGTLVIKGEKSEETETEDGNRYLHERRFGAFERRMPLPDGVDTAAVTATYAKGILTVRVPVPTETAAPATKIAVEVT